MGWAEAKTLLRKMLPELFLLHGGIERAVSLRFCFCLFVFLSACLLHACLSILLSLFCYLLFALSSCACVCSTAKSKRLFPRAYICFCLFVSLSLSVCLSIPFTAFFLSVHRSFFPALVHAPPRNSNGCFHRLIFVSLCW